MSYTELGGLVLGTGLVAAFTCALLHRIIHHDTFRRYHEVGYAVFLQLGVIFAVLLAFVFNNVWSNYNVASQAIDSECASLHGIAILGDRLPSPARNAILDDLHAYLTTVLDREWPDMQRRKESQAADARFQLLWQTVETVNTDPADNQIRGQLLSLLATAHQSRETRLFQMRQGVPGLVWSLLIVFASGLVGCMLVFAAEASLSKAVLVGVFTSSLTLALLTVRELDFPFESALQLSSRDFNETLGKVDHLMVAAKPPGSKRGGVSDDTATSLIRSAFLPTHDLATRRPVGSGGRSLYRGEETGGFRAVVRPNAEIAPASAESRLRADRVRSPRRQSLRSGWVVILDVSDARAHRPAGHLPGGKRREQGFEFGRVRWLLAKPNRPGFGLEDHRHAVVKRRAQFVRRGRDDGEASNPLARGRTPVLPQAGQGHQAPVGKRDRIGLLARPGLLPFVEAVDGHEAAAALERFTKGRPVVDPLGLGVDVGETDVEVLGPERHETPSQQVEAALAGLGVVPDDGERVGRRHIPARREIGSRPMWRDREDKFDLADIGGETGASTHDPNHILAVPRAQWAGHGSN